MGIESTDVTLYNGQSVNRQNLTCEIRFWETRLSGWLHYDHEYDQGAKCYVMKIGIHCCSDWIGEIRWHEAECEVKVFG